MSTRERNFDAAEPGPQDVYGAIEAELPPILFRHDPDFRRLVGLSPRTVANLDSVGKGPSQRVVAGNRVGYPKPALLAWLRSRSRIEERNGI